MKNIILILFFSLIFYTSQAQTVPNGDFESGVDTLSLSKWHTINELTGIFFPFTRTTDSYSGDYAVKLETLSIFNTLVPGLATLGQISIGDVQGAIPFPYKPDKLTGMYKHPTDKDASLIWVYFLKNQGNKVDTIGQGTFIPDGKINQYKSFEIDIDYYAESVPDSMNILLISDSEVPNSTFYIDKLEFIYNSTSIPENIGGDVNIYPIPTSTFVNIKRSELSEKKLILMNLFGEIIVETNIHDNHKLDLSAQPAGIYFIVIDNKNYKIIKN